MDASGGLQRSEISFRRTGSSGLVWDDKFLGELAKIKPASQDPAEPRRLSSASAAADPPTTLPRSRSEGGAARQQGYKTMKATEPSVDPPSPKVGCGGICSIFGKEKQQQRIKRPAKRRV